MASPGLTEWANVDAGPIRGSHYFNATLYVVSGGSLYSVDSGGLETSRGSIAGTDMVRMADNGAELAIAANGTGYVWSGGVLYTPVGFAVSDVAYVDGYFLWTIKDTDQFLISALNDGLTYDPADIASAEGSPDGLKGVFVSHRDVLLFGEISTEVDYNSGNADFPFERQGNAFIERGCFDRDSIVGLDNTAFFVGNDRIVYRLDGYTPMRISTHAIEYELRDITYAQGFTYTQEGHKFYGLRTDNGTFLMDQATGLWHQRQSFNLTNWRVNGAVDAYGRTLLTSGEDGKIYVPSLDVFAEDGEPILFDIYLPTTESARNWLTCYAFEVLCETGVGNGDVADPQIMLRYSDDGGNLWSNEMWRSLGAIGARRTRAIWRKLGRFRQRQFHIRISDACRKLVISYWMDAR